MTVSPPTQPATPDALGVPGATQDAPRPDDPLLSYFADGSFYAGAAGFVLPAVTLFFLAGTSGFAFPVIPLVFAMLGPAAVTFGVLAQQRPTARWRNGTAWLGIFLGLLDSLIYAVVFAAIFGFIL